jgi:hypothetical protein
VETTFSKPISFLHVASLKATKDKMWDQFDESLRNLSQPQIPWGAWFVTAVAGALTLTVITVVSRPASVEWRDNQR